MFYQIDNKEAFTTELHFSQYVITHCPQLHLLSLVKETELTNGFTLTASLAASDAVQVTLSPSTTEIDVMKVQPSSQAAPTSTDVTRSTEGSLYTLVAVAIGTTVVCFITIIISGTVIISCYCRRAKTQRMITNSTEPPMYSMVDHAYGGMPYANTGIYDFIKSKNDPLPNVPEGEYETMKPAPSILAGST